MRFALLAMLLLAVLLSGCGTDQGPAPSAGAPLQQPAAQVWPTVLPHDGVQPWETTDASGNVVPAARSSSSVNGHSIFASGEQSFASGGAVTTVGAAAHLDSGASGSHDLSYATYRLTLGGVQPGVVGLDVNLDSAGSAYWVGLSDYSANHWVWRGPFTDNHIRLVKALGQLDSSNYLSGSGNLFVAVAAYGGSSVDVVGVGANPVTDGDAAIPPAPAAFAATPEPGGLLLEWTPSAAGDLAGYRVLHGNSPFASASDPGVQTYDYADGGGRLFLPLPQHLTFVALQAVDIAGNASALTTVLNAVPLTGTPPALTVTASAPSGLHDAPITLTATGAASYDFDLDGDGVYDVTGNTTGTANVDTSKPGIVRPGVRGHGADRQAVALGGVSLIITGNTPPSVSAVASPQAGTAPLDVTFTATAQDVEDAPAALTYAWDFDGDGIYEPSTNQASLHNIYSTPGTFNASVRVTDSQGAWSAYPVVVTVSAAPPPLNQPPTASFTVGANQQILPLRLSYSFDGSASSDPEDGAPAHYDWDFNGDGIWDAFDGPGMLAHTYADIGTYNATLRIRDSAGASSSLSQPVYVPSAWNSHGGAPGSYTRCSAAVGPSSNNLLWSAPTGNGIEASPVIGANGTVYASSDDHKLYALQWDGMALTTKWTFSTGNAIFGGPAVGADGTVYLGCEDGKLYALADNGTTTPTLKWTYDTGSAIYGSVATAPGGEVIITALDGTVYALLDTGAATPTLKWSYTIGSNILGSAAVGADGTVYVSSENKKVYALSDNGTATPTQRWSYAMTGIFVTTPAIGPDGTVYIGNNSGLFVALQDNGTTTPTVKWSIGIGLTQATAAVGADGTVYIGDNVGRLYALTDSGGATPNVRWSYLMNGAPQYSSPAVDAAGTVYIGSVVGTVYALRQGTSGSGEVAWSYATGNTINSSPAIGPDGTVYIGSYDHKIYAFGQ